MPRRCDGSSGGSGALSGMDSQWRFLAERYELLGRLGTGAVGAVWLVRDREGGSEYAIKILKPELTAHADAVAALRPVLETVRGLGQPNIVAVDDVVSYGGRLALVMRPVPGENLSVLLSRMGKLAPAHAAQLLAQLCDALSAAHAADVAHGGIKPANVLLEPLADEAGSLRVGLTDFGVARMAAAAGVTPLKDEVGLLFYEAMPIEYQAPEIGVGCVASPAADVYAVGVLLYEAISGRPPFTGSAQKVQEAHASLQPPRIPDLPDPLWLLIAACLDKHPQHRPSAPDLASLLREIAPTVEATAQLSVQDAGGAPTPLTPTPLTSPLLTPAAERTQRLQPVPSTVPVLTPAVALPLSSTLVRVGGASRAGGEDGALIGSHRVFTAPRRIELAAVVSVIVLAFAATWLFSSLGSNPPVKATFAAVPTQQPSSTSVALDDGGAFGTASPSGSASASPTASVSARPSASVSASASAPAVSPSAGPQSSPSSSVVPPPSPSSSPGQGGGGGGQVSYVNIVNAGSGLWLDSGGNVPAWSRLKQWASSPSWNVQWELVAAGNGYYRIVNHANGMVVDSGGGSNDGNTAVQSPWVGSDDQLWSFSDAGGGRVHIINRATGLALDDDNSNQIGSSVVLWQQNPSPNNEWTVTGA